MQALLDGELVEVCYRAARPAGTVVVERPSDGERFHVAMSDVVMLDGRTLDESIIWEVLVTDFESEDDLEFRSANDWEDGGL